MDAILPGSVATAIEAQRQRDLRHNHAILKDLGFSDEDIAGFEADGILFRENAP